MIHELCDWIRGCFSCIYTTPNPALTDQVYSELEAPPYGKEFTHVVD